MLSFDDERWDGLQGGYRTPFDPRPALRALESEKEPKLAWHELWEGLHHQGDVGEASYAAVPHIVRIYRQRGIPDWNPYAIVGIIELGRDEKRNPRMPEWLQRDYSEALQDLAKLGVTELAFTDDPEVIRSILSILAIGKGARIYGRMLLNYSQEELLDFEARAMS